LNASDYARLLDDPEVARRVAVENLMLVALSLRPLSQTTIPAELPGGATLGGAIDSRFKPRLERLKAMQDQKAKIKEIGEIRKGMASAFEDIVEKSSEYKALQSWVKRLDLRVNQVEVRPTVHEFYLYKEKDILRELQALMQERGRLRVEAIKKPNPAHGEVQFAYPEEFNGAWIRRMGRLLGYPDCCVARYAEDREKGVNAEARAAAQLKELATEPDHHAYLSGYFFPCSPTCENAIKKGYSYHEGLQKTLPQAGEAYEKTLKENLDRVRKQPEIIGEYLSRIKGV
jgi:hypothetical protein